jgi:transposase
VHPENETGDEGASYIEWRRTVLVPRQEYSRELRLAAMREIDSGEGMAEVARMYQLSPKRMETWRSEWRAKGELAFPGKGAQPKSKLDADRISELERKIGQQTMEIDFLKKTLRRFREQLLPVAVNGGTDSMSKSKRRAKRGQS